MSTKIYNGYKFKKPVDLHQIHTFCHNLRDGMKPLAKKLYFKQWLSEAVKAYDLNQFGFWTDVHYFIKNKAVNNIYFGVDRYMDAKMQRIERTQQRDPQYDFNFAISILPLKTCKEVLVLLYTERKEMVAAFERLPEIQEYHYQNSSDKPKNISEKKWNLRSDHWDDALGGDGYATPSEAGFEYKPIALRYLSFSQPQDNRWINRLFPTLKKRSARIAHLIMMQRWNELHPVAAAKGTDNEPAMKRYWAFTDFMKTMDGIREHEQVLAEVLPQLRVFKKKNELNMDMVYHSNIENILAQGEKSKPYCLE